ncbi:MAG: DNA-directed RNA polymerase subunit beta [Bacilli bacterium]|jgi:DNA-directed RNA polymerase subunit beta
MEKSKKEFKLLGNSRRDYSKISGTLPLPNLVEVQTESYKWLIEAGLDEALKDVFPITNYADNLELQYLKFRFDEPTYTYLECKERDMTYSAPLRVTLRLIFKETSVINDAEVFLGDFPMMTESGTFIINGVEKVIVSQIRRSPGAYLSETMDKTGKLLYKADLIPMRGTWLEFESDIKDVLTVRIDRQRKMYATIFLKAIGLEDPQQILDLFGDREALRNTLEKDADTKSITDGLVQIFSKMKPGEPRTPEGIVNFIYQKFFDPKRYNLGVAGRYKYAKKLGVYSRLVGMILAEDLVGTNKKIRVKKNTLMTKELVDELRSERFFEKGAHEVSLPIFARLDPHDKVNIVHVYNNEKKEIVSPIVGTDLNLTMNTVTIPDMIATFSSFMNLMDGFGQKDDIDHLGNRRIHSVGELIQNRFRVGLSKMGKSIREKMSISDITNVTPQSLVNIKPLTSQIKEFFSTDPLSQFMDQTNPLAELTNKRRISALGSGGIKRDRASFDVRDVHYSHYGRICPIETPEGQNIGLITNLATYAKVNNYGFIETPYRRVDKQKGRVLDETVYLSAEQERPFIIAQATDRIDAEGYFLDDTVIARADGDNIMADVHEVDYIDVSPKQVVSVASACIPFLENDDTTRALMGANMQRQALPLLRPSAPFVGTGIESTIARDSGLAVVAQAPGTVSYVDSRQVVVDEEKGPHIYRLQKFNRSNQGTCINQVAIVKPGAHVEKGTIIADGPAMSQGELALGQNVTIAFMTWNGYNYEDAVIMSERLVKEDVYTSIHIEEHTLECRATKLGNEEITRDVPNINEDAKAFLDDRGIIVPGAEVKENDILVGKVTPKGQTEPTAEEKLLRAIFSEKTKEGKDSSLRVPHGGAGIVLDVKVFSRKKGDELPPGVNEVVRVYIVQKRKISEGDKMSGRHGNKGVISRILPVEDMPFLPDGTPIDIMLNPLGVPSRMNIGQILEIHLGMAAKKLGLKIATPVFDGISNDEILDLMKQAGVPEDGKTILHDGRTGEAFDERISVGVMYMIKLVHMVDDKLHARATGPYSLVTQQPLGGKAQNGGQRFGEMEVWALEAYGAAHTLQEILTIKSDDRVGRRKTYEAIIKGRDIPRPGIPESFKVLTKELQSLAIDVRMYDQNNQEIDMEALAKEALAEERKINSSIRAMTSETVVDLNENAVVDDSYED